jgi:hypothetical protein
MGRTRKYKNDNERKRAYRIRKREARRAEASAGISLGSVNVDGDLDLSPIIIDDDTEDLVTALRLSVNEIREGLKKIDVRGRPIKS